MSRDLTNRLASVVLVLGVLTIAGMVTATWQLVLYPTLLIVGALLAISVTRNGRTALGIPVGVTVLLVALFGILHAMGVASPSGRGTVLGWDPMTALYLFVVGPAFLLVDLLYALTDRTATTPEENLR
jgi:4-amino-4-deoxy-L-arabinose transferase-like glycosyltransferase